jgi:hypothetical protein
VNTGKTWVMQFMSVVLIAVEAENYLPRDGAHEDGNFSSRQHPLRLLALSVLLNGGKEY